MKKQQFMRKSMEWMLFLAAFFITSNVTLMNYAVPSVLEEIRKNGYVTIAALIAKGLIAKNSNNPSK